MTIKIPKKKTYTAGEFARMLGVSYYTLVYWDKEDILKAKRTITNRRYYTEDQLDYVQKGKN